MKAMITRREFTKTLGGVAALVTLSPVSSWANGEARVSAAAGKLYRESFILDGNVLASIGSLLDKVDQKDVTKAVRESGITAINVTVRSARRLRAARRTEASKATGIGLSIAKSAR